MKKRMFAFGVTLASMLVLAACGETEETQAEPQETAVAVAEVYEGSLTGTNRFIGRVEAGGNGTIIPKIAGELVEVRVEKGEQVERNQVLARIDAGDLQLQLDADEAQLEQARNGLRRAENGREQAQSGIRQAESSLRQAEQGLSSAREASKGQQEAARNEQAALQRQLEEAQDNLARVTALAAEGEATAEQVEQAQTALDGVMAQMNSAGNQGGGGAPQGQDLSSMESAVNQAEAGVEQAESATRDANIAIEDAQAMVEQAEAAVQRSRERLDDALIRATIAGEIVSLDGNVGDVVSQQAPFAQIISLSSVIVTINVTGDQLGYFQTGNEVELDVAGVDGRQTAEVTFVSPTAAETGLFPVEVEITNPDAGIRQGMVATVFVDEMLVEDELIVPTEAILERQSQTYVFVVVDGAVKQVDVEVIRFDSEESAIRGEIAVGDEVVVLGQHLIDDADPVRIVREDA